MRWVAAVALLCVLAAAPAQASTARVVLVDTGDRLDVSYDTYLQVAGERGEANRIVVRALSGNRYEVRDRGARLRARAGCRARGRHRAVCRPEDSVAAVFVDLRDRDDRLRLRRTAASVSGGGGDDRLRGSRAGDILAGGPGRDRLAGGGGNDRLEAGDGRGRRERDRLAGGPGIDRVSWFSSGLPVSARLRGRRLRGAGDRGTGIESLRGSARSDRLRGGGRDDRLHGGGGDDVLIGGGGDDRLRGGGFATTDDVRCGPGRDRVIGPNLFVFVRSDCELLQDQFDPFVTVRPRLRLLPGGRVETRIDCASPDGILCFIEVELRSAPSGVPGAPAGRSRRLARRVDVEDLEETGREARIVFRLSALGRRYLGAGGRPACVSDGETGFCARVPRLRG